MTNNYSKVEKISNEGYSIEFGTILEKAFNNYKLIAGTGGLAMLLFTVIFIVLFGSLFAVIYGFRDFTSTMTGLDPKFMTGPSLLFFTIFTVVISGIISPINAGLIRMAYLADQKQHFDVGTMFHYYKGTYFKELFLSGILIGFFSGGINSLFAYFGISFIGALWTYVVAFLTFLTIPLIIFSDLKAVEAITMSMKLILKQPILLLGLLIVAIIFAVLGIFGLCIGIFFTLPFLFSMYYSIYNTILPIDEVHELNEIGQNPE